MITSDHEEHPSRTQGRAIDKVPTRISGLDDVLWGGLPLGRTSLIAGGPGTGKTVLGLELLYRAAHAGNPGVFITFEERADALRQNAWAMGWDLASLEQDGRLSLVEATVPPDLVLSGDFTIDGLLSILRGQVRELGARLIVIDALDVLLRIFQEPLPRQSQFQLLHQWINEQGVTAVLTAKASGDRGQSGEHPLLDYMADCVIRLEHVVHVNVPTRRLRVHKYRGSAFFGNNHPYTISDEGVVLMPVETAELVHAPLGESVSSGQEQFDQILGGGFRRTSSVLFAGTSGTGKTTVAATFALGAWRRGERVLFVSFEQSREALVSSMLAPGIDLRPALESGHLRVLTAMPESLGVEDHLLRVFDAERAFAPSHMVVDAISACQRMGSEQAGFDFLVRLLTYCKERGITCLCTNQLGEGGAVEQMSGFGISSLVDTLILLEQVHRPMYRRRALIIKSRGVGHSHAYHEFTIGDDGLDFPPSVETNEGAQT